MSDLVRRAGPPDGEGRIVAVTPESAGWRHTGFEAYRMSGGATVRRDGGTREECLVLLAGGVRIAAAGAAVDLGPRRDPFTDLPWAMLLPAGEAYAIEALTDGTELAIGSAPGDAGGRPQVVTPDSITVEVRGSGAMERSIRPILMEDRAAHSLLVVEVLTPAGHWSSYPPHRHDRDDPPRERQLEEVYHHRLRDPRGFALQRVYSDDRELDERIVVGDGDTVLVPRGYHPVAAAPGYELYYLNVMAGPVREWLVHHDPDHAWLLEPR
jgi:5-deoxy-glucuronate isomerase